VGATECLKEAAVGIVQVGGGEQCRKRDTKAVGSCIGLAFVSVFSATGIKVDVVPPCRAQGFLNPA